MKTYWDKLQKDHMGNSPETSDYDSTSDTLLHIDRVNSLLIMAAEELQRRGKLHDQSKLQSPEKEAFDRAPQLAHITFGSKEYEDSIKNLNKALKHHYQNNSHHPQHYPNGVDGFDLFDLVEMFFDWKAASERTHGGNIFSSLELNQDRFNISTQLYSILWNTARNYFPKQYTEYLKDI